MAAKIGDIYRKEVAVPTGMLLSAQKYRVNEVSPANARTNKMGRLDPKGEILFFLNRKNTKVNVPIERKKTNSKAGSLETCFMSTFILVNATEEIKM